MLDKTLTQDLSKIVEPRFLNKFAKDQDLNDLDKINYVLEVYNLGINFFHAGNHFKVITNEKSDS